MEQHVLCLKRRSTGIQCLFTSALVIYLASDQSRSDVWFLVVAFVAQYPPVPDEFRILVFVHLVFGANLPDTAIEIREFLNYGLLDDFRREDVTSALVLVLGLRIRVVPSTVDMATGGLLD